MGKNGSNLLLAILNFLGFLGVIIVNALANILPINNNTTGALSDKYPNLFVPAGLTFSIWGVIYILLAIYSVYQLVAAIKNDAQKSSFMKKIGILFFVSCLANMGWIFAWQYEIVPLSVIVMLAFLGVLIAIYLRLRIGKSDSTKTEKYMVHLPFSVYLGWITVATIANITALLVQWNWNGFGLDAQFWTVAVIVVAIAINLIMLFNRRDIFFCLVGDWALLGILIKRLSLPGEPAQAVVITVIIGLALITAGIIAQLVRKKVY
jgi:hypothetical protein